MSPPPLSINPLPGFEDAVQRCTEGSGRICLSAVTPLVALLCQEPYPIFDSSILIHLESHCQAILKQREIVDLTTQELWDLIRTLELQSKHNRNSSSNSGTTSAAGSPGRTHQTSSPHLSFSEERVKRLNDILPLKTVPREELIPPEAEHSPTEFVSEPADDGENGETIFEDSSANSTDQQVPNSSQSQTYSPPTNHRKHSSLPAFTGSSLPISPPRMSSPQPKSSYHSPTNNGSAAETHSRGATPSPSVSRSPSFGRRRTTPVMIGGTSARQAATASKARAASDRKSSVDTSSVIDDPDLSFSSSTEYLGGPDSSISRQSSRLSLKSVVNTPSNNRKSSYFFSDDDVSKNTKDRSQQQHQDVFYTPSTTLVRRTKSLYLENSRLDGRDFETRLRMAASDENVGGSRDEGGRSILQEFVHEVANNGNGPAARVDANVNRGSQENQSEIARLEDATVELMKKLKDSERLHANYHKYSEQKIVELEAKIKEFTEDLAIKKKHISELKSKEKNLLRIVEDLESQSESLAKELRAARMLCTELKAQQLKHNEYEIVVEEIELQNEQSRSNEEASQRQINVLEREMKRILEENRQFAERMADLERRVTYSDNAMKVLLQENAELKVELEDYKVKLQARSEEDRRQKNMLSPDRVSSRRHKSLKKELEDSAYDSESPAEDTERSHFGSVFPVPLNLFRSSPRQSSTQTDPIMTPITLETGMQTDAIAKPIKLETYIQTDTAPRSEISTQTTIDQSAIDTQTDFLPTLSDVSFVTDVRFTPRASMSVGAQTELTVEEIKALDAHRADVESKYRELSLDYAMLEKCVDGMKALEEQVQAVEEEKALMGKNLAELQASVLDQRRQFSIRKHYDAEVERWIDALRAKIEKVDKVYTEVKSATSTKNENVNILLQQISKMSSDLAKYEEREAIYKAKEEEEWKKMEELRTKKRAEEDTPEDWSDNSRPSSPTERAGSDLKTRSREMAVAAKTTVAGPVLSSLTGSLLRLPRWALPMVVYTLVVWNTGAAMGPVQNLFNSLMTGSNAMGYPPNMCFSTFGVNPCDPPGQGWIPQLDRADDGVVVTRPQ
ncbi:hypothetical protein HDU76_012702 [Blyttiomyces sp. JEL0837]|nr:hypothetical protein HDU76_012702 [Blyttiomyces sp. JEL0837]